MIITITLNAALDRTQRIEHPLQVGKLNRAVSSHLEPGGKGINVSRAIKALGGEQYCAWLQCGHKRPHYEGHADSSGHSPRFC